MYVNPEIGRVDSWSQATAGLVAGGAAGRAFARAATSSRAISRKPHEAGPP